MKFSFEKCTVFGGVFQGVGLSEIGAGLLKRVQHVVPGMLLLEALIKKLCVSPRWFHLTQYHRIF